MFSPIVYGRNFEKQMGGAAKNWSVFNEAMLGRATALWVLQLPGWDESLGVLAEIQMYQFLFPYAIRFVEPL